MFSGSVDLYEDLACCGYKRECQGFRKILHMLIARLKVACDGEFPAWRGLHLMKREIPLVFATSSRCFLAVAEVIILLTSAYKSQYMRTLM